MKFWALGVLASGILAANFQAQGPNSNEYVIFLSGDAQGYLSPCGCSAPMIGGTKRRARAIAQLGNGANTLLLENGGLVKSAGRQDEIKLETFAQLHAESHGAILNLTPAEAKLGQGALLSMSRLSKGRLVSGSVRGVGDWGIPKFRKEGPFLIGGVSMHSEQIAGTLGVEPIPADAAVQSLVDSAKQERKAPILVLDGDKTQADAIARRFPSLALIQYRTAGRPTEKSHRIGNVLLASPADGGRYLVRLVWRTDRFVSFVPVELDPSYKDHEVAARTYKTYLNRISHEKLLEAVPRGESPKYSGTQTCASCHAESASVWSKSKHAIALKTLEKIGHDRDPDCVECHVVGLASIYGFRSRSETPQLAAVGCESCHGPGADHSANPKHVKMGVAGEKSCIPCHQIENSPKFDFKTYWGRIRHK